jgi:glucose-specific phosphotransferase system IIA component
MGLFDFLKKKKQNDDVSVETNEDKVEYVEGIIYSPLNGKFVAAANIPDPVFSQGMMGPAVGIDPETGNGVVYSPINGEVVTIFPTKHAIGLKTNNGIEVLIHFGLDTVALQGEGFTSHIESNQKVVVGQKLVTVDMNAIKGKVPSLVTPVVITSQEDIEVIAVEGEIKAGDPLMKVIKK